MTALSEEGQRIVGDIAARHGVSTGAVEHLLMAVMAGYGSQAQFNHPDFGGMGQWSQGGMTMVGDMFNNGLKARVDMLCNELSGLVRNSDLLARPSGGHQSQSQGGGGQFQGDQYQAGGQYQGQFQDGSRHGGQSQGGGVSLFVPDAFQQGGGWPAELGQPGSTGAQNNLRYAFFPATRRLAIDLGGQITVYDTRDHQISGFSQQQSGDQSLSFNSQYGLVRVSDLDVVPSRADTGNDMPQAAEPSFSAANRNEARPAPQAPRPPAASPAPQFRAEPAPSDEDVFDKIEKLAGLHAKGILTDAEYQAKKAELLGRL